MTTFYKKLGGVNPTLQVLTSLYQTPALKSTVVSTINVCNFGTTPATIRIGHVEADVASAANSEDWIIYDVVVGPNSVLPLSVGVTMGTLDSLAVYASTSNVTFIAWGAEEA
ncbi:MAG: hypothetical protein PHT13_00250 [Methanosarcina sp.]|nr:hypothetical protein [Methanosarcina sp.]